MPIDVNSLEFQAQATVPASGTVSVVLGPIRPGINVRPTAIAVSCIGSTAQPTATWYKNSVNPQNLGSNTFLGGSGDTDNNPGVTLYAGEQIVVQWVGATPGAIAVAKMTCDVVS